MQRRTVLIGVGSTAIGTGAAFGSGALSQVTADRDATVTVVEDESGFVGIDLDEASSHVEKSDGTYSITLDGTNAGDAEGVNADAETVLGQAVSSIVNQSGQEIELTIEIDGGDSNGLIEIRDWNQGSDSWVSKTNTTVEAEGDDVIGETLVLADGEGLNSGDFVVTDEVSEGQTTSTLDITANTTA